MEFQTFKISYYIVHEKSKDIDFNPLLVSNLKGRSLVLYYMYIYFILYDTYIVQQVFIHLLIIDSFLLKNFLGADNLTLLGSFNKILVNVHFIVHLYEHNLFNIVFQIFFFYFWFLKSSNYVILKKIIIPVLYMYRTVRLIYLLL